MRATWSIFKREFTGYFRTPVAYVFLTVFLVASVGLPWFVGQFFDNNDASLRIFFRFQPWVFLFLIPAVGMRLWSEEKRLGTWELLFTMPVTIWQAVLGKFLAGWAVIILAMALTLSMPLTVAWLGDPDWGMIASGYVGTVLMAGAYLAICSLSSALTRSQVISFVLSLITCLLLVLLGASFFNEFLLSLDLPIWVVDGIADFSFLTHYSVMTQGVIRFEDLIFFVSLTLFCLLVNTIILER